MINYGISISLPIFHIQTFEEDTSKETFPKNFKDVVGNSIQIMFNKRKLDKDDIVFINSFVKNHNLKYVFVHASYQINIAAEFLYKNDIPYNPPLEILLQEISYASKINAQGIVVHMGKNVKQKYDHDVVYNNMVNFVLQLFKNKIPKNFFIIFETTAGQKGDMCWDLFDFVNFILLFKNTKFYDKIGICIDTCHIFQAGYDLNNQDVINKVHKIFEPIKNKIKLIHLNDSLLPYNSHIDKHQRLGEGHIKIPNLLKFIKPYLSVPLILETEPPFPQQIIKLKII